MDITLGGLRALSADLKDLRPFLKELGDRASRVVLEEGRKDSGGDLILSNFGRGGRKGRMILDVQEDFGIGVVTLRPNPVGPWMLMEAGSHKGYWWEPRKGSRKKAVVLPDGSVRRYVRHGPVAGRSTITRAKKKIDAQLHDWAAEILHARILKVAA